MYQGTMLNLYADSMGGHLSEVVEILSRPEWKDAFQSIYLLPSVFNSDIDRGYSIISYDLAETIAKKEDFERLKEMGFDLLFDFILNHLSVLSPQFQDIIAHGEKSPYCDFFIDWNKFWEGHGEANEEGIIVPYPDAFALVRRRNGLPILNVRYPDGREVAYWNTFFQKVFYPEVDEFDLISLVDAKYDIACQLAKHINQELKNGAAPGTMNWDGYEKYREIVGDYLESKRRYLGQMDVNVKSPLVWKWFDEVLEQLASLGTSMVRLDAMFSLLKEPGKRFGPVSPEASQLMGKLKEMAGAKGLDILPECHEPYAKGFYLKQWEMGVPCYDYYLPALLIDAMDLGESQYVYNWAKEQIEAKVRTINMLGCHDGIPLSDPRGLLPNERVDALEERLVGRGGRRKYVHGDDTAEVYQMDIAYYSALECDDRKLNLARAVQIFMPAKPQIWYQDLLAGANDLEIFERVPDADNREINRHNYTMEEIEENMKRPVVQEQIRLLQFRNTHPVFCDEAEVWAEQTSASSIVMGWQYGEHSAKLYADFQTLEYRIES